MITPPNKRQFRRWGGHFLDARPWMIAVLCCSKRSIYKSLQGVDCFDQSRDALTFDCSMPVIAHPPCRAWSAFCRHQAKPERGEMELGLWCVRAFRLCGGILEHPAHSRLFDEACLPKPGDQSGAIWTMAVKQAWWGYPTTKATWLSFNAINPINVDIPYRLHQPRGDKRRMQVMSKAQRSATTPEFAKWLVALAGKAFKQ